MTFSVGSVLLTSGVLVYLLIEPHPEFWSNLYRYYWYDQTLEYLYCNILLLSACWSAEYNVAFHCICITDFFCLVCDSCFFPLNNYDTDIKRTIQSTLESTLLNQAVDHYVYSDVLCFLKKMAVRYADSNFFLNKFNIKQLAGKTLVTIVGNIP